MMMLESFKYVPFSSDLDFPELRLVIHNKCLIGGIEQEKVRRYIAETGVGRTIYHERVNKAHKAVADRIWIK